MGKKNSGSSSSSSSWINIVKRAFRSPVKDNSNNNNVNDKRNGRRRDDSGLDHEEEEKKREKRRWLFRKPSRSSQPAESKEQTVEILHPQVNPVLASTEQRHAIAVAAATAAAAEAAMATAQAAMEIARLARSNPQPPPGAAVPKQLHCAALAIQTAFRGYLARRALRALKGLVRLQALVRGHNVRKQAKLTLRCMQALVRVQDRMRDQRARLSHDGVSRKSMFTESTNNLWESSYLQDIRERRSTSRNTSCCTADFWDEKEQQPAATKLMDEIEAVLQVRQREKTLVNAFSQQIWRSRRQPSAGDEKEMMEERTEWLDRWMAAKQWETESRASTDKRDPIKTVEVDTSRPYSSYGSAPPKNYGRRSLHHYRQPPSPSPNHFSSPLHRPNPPSMVHSPVTPSPSKTRPIQVRSASPRSYRGDDRFYSAANTPCLSSAAFYTTQRYHANTVGPVSTMIPNYMAATESARARARSQSAPRQRPLTPERDRGGTGPKKRLSYPEQQQHQQGPVGGYINHHNNHGNLRSPSFKSAYAAEQRSNLSCYTESMIGGEISPCSTTDLRWFR